MLVDSILIFLGFFLALLSRKNLEEEIKEFRNIFKLLLLLLLFISAAVCYPVSLISLLPVLIYYHDKFFALTSLVTVLILTFIVSSEAVFVVSLSVSIISGWLMNIKLQTNKNIQ